jgi:transposase
MKSVTDDDREGLTDEAANRFLIPDELWRKIEPLLPVRRNTHRFGGGRPRASDRRCMDGIFFVLRTGCQWNALSATGICPSSTAHDRFQEWVRAGVFLRLWEAGLLEYDRLKGIDWRWLSMDGAITKAPLGGGKNRPESRGPRQARRETLAADRGRRRAGRAGRRRGQPQRP